MINVMNLLSLPQFNSFKVISDSKGLCNIVKGTGIWEWERPEVIEQTFLPGEFVFTTLSALREDEAWAIDSLQTLIRKKVSAIAIKTVYFDSCPKDILTLANEYKVPILTFSEAYMDDLIYVIKNAVLSNNSNNIMLEHLKEIIRCENEDLIVEKVRRMNPLFFDHLICFCCFAQGDQETDLLNKALFDYQNSIVSEQAPVGTCYSFIRCNRCIIIIYTVENSIPSFDAMPVEILSHFILNMKAFYVGVSEVKHSRRCMKQAIDEAVAAALNAVLENEAAKQYDEIGADAFLLSNIENQHFKAFYKKTYQCLSDYDDKHNSDLMKTLICYVESEGDIALTSKRLFQHNNTVRYRLDKIKKLLNITSSLDTEIQFYVFVRMYKLKKNNLLSKELII